MSEELRLRIISALVLAALVLGLTYWGGMAFKVLAGLIGLLVQYEWLTVTGEKERDRAGFTIAWTAQAVIAVNILIGTIETSWALIFAFGAVLVVRAVLRKFPLWLPAGVVYSGLSAVSLAGFRGEDHTGLVAILFLFAVVWGTDILAYFVGRAVGGPKLAPKISPGKTWSGAAGGTVSAVLAGIALLYAFGISPDLRLVVIAFVLSVVSQAGDLFESFIKRKFGVKDSSKLIPGHGGVMDRVDGLVAASFTAFATISAWLALSNLAQTGHASILLGQ